MLFYSSERNGLMKALVLESDKHLVVRQIAMPQRTRPSDVLIKVVASGICGSDLHRGFGGGAYHYPLVMGHEFAGVVAEGDSQGRWEVGARVAVFPLLPCFECAACVTGNHAQCHSYDYLGSRSDGGFAEYVVAPSWNLFAVPQRVSMMQAAMAEPCAVALHGVRGLRIAVGMDAVVFGAGPIGMLCAQWLARSGAHPVTVVDIDEKKLAIARGLGFKAINALSEPVVERIREATQGRGVSLAIEACGLAQTFTQALECAAVHGQVLFMGNISSDLQLSKQMISSILRRELTIRGTWNSQVVPRPLDDWSVALEAMGNGLELDGLVSHTPTLDEAVEIFSRIQQRDGFFNKVIVKINEELFR
jgi:L-iditol 2-dehydrogenase/galactitol-1-phosphate 5-dehydrogenase